MKSSEAMTPGLTLTEEERALVEANRAWLPNLVAIIDRLLSSPQGEAWRPIPDEPTAAMLQAAIDAAPMLNVKEWEERKRRAGRFTLTDHELWKMFQAVYAALPEAWRPITDETLALNGQFLVTNNIDARDAYGKMSHVWRGFIIKADDPSRTGPYVSFDDRDRMIHNITHYCEIPLPAAPSPTTHTEEKHD